MSCNICSTKLRESWSAALSTTYVEPFGEKCRSCGSRPRIRAMAYAIDNGLSAKLKELDIRGMTEGLLMASPQVEQDLLQSLIGSFVTTSLYGKYGRNHVFSNAEDLKEFNSDTFDFAEACGVFDFIEGAEQAFESVSRVLRQRAIFFFHIGGGHLKDGNMPPTLKRFRTDWSANYYPSDYKQPIVLFGRDWIEEKLQSLGFQVKQITWTDPGTAKYLTWWLSWRA